MALSLSEVELKQITGELFLFRDPNPLALAKPVASGAGLALRIDPIALKPRFKDISFSVVDFTANLMAPDIWFHREELGWQMASTGKLAILLAAVQLRDDLRRVLATGLVSGAADLDELFSTIGKRSPLAAVQEVASANGSPRISTIFDLSISPEIDFDGGDVPHDRVKLSSAALHQKWSKEPDLTFWERMWQVGSQSDNVAACSCGSEIGMAYIKAVQRAYGLFGPPGMRMLLGAAYGSPPAKTPIKRASALPVYRRVINTEAHTVINGADPTKTLNSTQGASTAALTAYMLALMQNRLFSTVPANALAGCDTIRECIADETPETMGSLIFDGVNSIATITKAHTKLGILGALRCEFAYLEADGKKYGVVGMGIRPKTIGSTTFSEVNQGQDLGKEIHTALIT